MTAVSPRSDSDLSECRVLVVGGGSMGRRRIRCLFAHGITSDRVQLCDLQDARRQQVASEYGIQTHSDLVAALGWSPHVVFVSVPGAYHLDVCISAARSNAHIFCEVPLSLSLDRVDELKRLVDLNKLHLVPAVQQVFHPLYQKMLEWLHDPLFGKPCFHSQAWGLYLPAWHPYEDYRKFYASDPKLGGGNLDVLAHEITVGSWLTGQRIVEVFCRATHCSSLEVKGPDYLQILAVTNEGMPVSLEFDLIQRAYRNEMRFVGEQGTLELRLQGVTRARRFLADSKEWDSVHVPDGYEYEQCYIDEVGHFLSCLRGDATWPISFDDAVYAVKVLVAIGRSIETRTSVPV